MCRGLNRKAGSKHSAQQPVCRTYAGARAVASPALAGGAGRSRLAVALPRLALARLRHAGRSNLADHVLAGSICIQEYGGLCETLQNYAGLNNAGSCKLADHSLTGSICMPNHVGLRSIHSQSWARVINCVSKQSACPHALAFLQSVMGTPCRIQTAAAVDALTLAQLGMVL